MKERKQKNGYLVRAAALLLAAALLMSAPVSASKTQTSKQKTEKAAAETKQNRQKPWIPEGFAFPGDLIEDAEPPMKVDWKEMKELNPDIIGWLYMEAIPQISYAICQSGDNDFYLHHNYLQESEYAGAIFADAINRGDFTDPNTLLFGHNMRNGTMFGSLKFLHTEGRIEKSPYFWVLTPKGNYRYHIFSMFYTPVDSDAYLLYGWNGMEFFDWEQEIRKQSLYENDVPLYPWDKVVYMSTCTSDSSQRFVVFGKCVSTERPYRYVNIFEYLNQSDSETDNKDSGESQEGNADSEGEGTEPSGETESSDGTE
ncbi:MAG: class B sortase [Lachnospiraceae bacterium]|nr:class B sortase [Lachnospiraceae bacterium]